MTRKDYKLIAEIIGRAYQAMQSPQAYAEYGKEILPGIVDDFCDALKAENSNFKREKFEAAVFGKRD